MKKIILPIFRVWLKRCLGLVFIVLATQTLNAGMGVSNDMYLFVRLMKQKGHLVFQVSITNKTSTELHLIFGDCPVAYVVQVENKRFTYPEKQPFVPAQTCTLRLREAILQPHSTVVVYATGMYPDLESALIKAKGYYSGEFRFEFSMPKSKKSFQLIYKRQLR